MRVLDTETCEFGHVGQAPRQTPAPVPLQLGAPKDGQERQSPLPGQSPRFLPEPPKVGSWTQVHLQGCQGQETKQGGEEALDQGRAWKGLERRLHSEAGWAGS